MWRYLWIGGRSTRFEWWVVHIGVMIALPIAAEVFFAARRNDLVSDDASVVAVLVVVSLLFWISFTSIVRRLHDRNKSGLWSLLYLPPFIGWAWFYIECGFLAGRAPPVRPEAGTIERLPEWRPTLRGTLKLAGAAVAIALFVMFWRVWVTSDEAFSKVTKPLDAPAPQAE